MFLTLLLRDSREHRQCRLIEVGQIRGHVLFQLCILLLRDCSSGKANLVKVDNPIAIISSLCELPLHGGVLLSLLDWIRMTCPFEPLQGLLLNLVELIHSTQQRRIHVCCWKLTLEMMASIIEAHAGLLPQSPFVHNPTDLVLLEETEAPSLSLMLVLPILQLLQE